jgi:hypothetical protein
MRTTTEIQSELIQVVFEIGKIELEKTKFLFAADSKLAPLHQRAEELTKEFQMVSDVQAEIEKSKEPKAI